MIDLTPGSVLVGGQIQGSVDNSKGKNNAQRIYREATGMNKPGEPFSWAMMQGKPVKVRIKHEDYQGNTVEKVAGAFGLKPWALLVDPNVFGRELGEMLHRPAATDQRVLDAISQSGKAAKPVNKSKAAIDRE